MPNFDVGDNVVMVILRATKKVLKSLPAGVEAGAESDTALGDWYVNRVVVDRQPLLLLVSAKSRLAIVDRGRDVRKLPQRLPGLVWDRLRRLGVNPEWLRLEMQAMSAVEVAPTTDRSVVGQLVDFAKALPYYLPPQDWNDASLRVAEDKFADTPCLCGRSGAEAIRPARETHTLLERRWGAPPAPSQPGNE